MEEPGRRRRLLLPLQRWLGLVQLRLGRLRLSCLWGLLVLPCIGRDGENCCQRCQWLCPSGCRCQGRPLQVGVR